MTIYVDSNNNGALDAGEPSAVTDANGDYTLTGLTANTNLTVREVVPSKWLPETTAGMADDGSLPVDIPDGQTVTFSFALARSLPALTGLTATSVSSGQVMLNWIDTGMGMETGTTIEESVDGGAFTTLDNLTSQVVSRQLFYNDSAQDGNNMAANTSDFNAIVTDRTALLPGEDAATQISDRESPISGYSKGINGVIVDITNLDGRTPTASDFTFKVGNDSSPGGWSDAPAPTAVTVFPGDGVGGSDRVEITWADNAIENEWLQVTVKADANTGLSADDVFYYGNMMGDATGDGTVGGNGATGVDGRTVDDDYDVWNNNFGATPTDGPSSGDFNVSDSVNITDLSVWTNNKGHSINLITAPSVPFQANYLVTGLSADHDYAFRVVSYDANGPSAESNTADPNTPTAKVQQIQTIVDDAGNTITLNWTSDQYVDFLIYRSDRTEPYARIPASSATLDADGSYDYTFTDTNVTPGVAYTYIIVPLDPRLGSSEGSGISTISAATNPTDNGVWVYYQFPFDLQASQVAPTTTFEPEDGDINEAVLGFASAPQFEGINADQSEGTGAWSAAWQAGRGNSGPQVHSAAGATGSTVLASENSGDGVAGESLYIMGFANAVIDGPTQITAFAQAGVVNVTVPFTPAWAFSTIAGELVDQFHYTLPPADAPQVRSTEPSPVVANAAVSAPVAPPSSMASGPTSIFVVSTTASTLDDADGDLLTQNDVA